MEPNQNSQGQQNGSDSNSQLFEVVNVDESKKPKKQATREDDNLWFNQIKYWIGISLAPSLLSLIIGIRYNHFFFLVPIFPMIAVAAWYVRKFFRDKNLDKEEWLK